MYIVATYVQSITPGHKQPNLQGKLLYIIFGFRNNIIFSDAPKIIVLCQFERLYLSSNH